MNTLDAIHRRRSIRRFMDRPIPRDVLERILEATVQAPSAKNAQPWRFVVLEGDAHRELVRLMSEQAEKLRALDVDIGSLAWTARAMAPAPVTVLVLMTAPSEAIPPEAHDDWQFVMLQSIGGAIQTMLLAAWDLGIASLWICDVLCAASDVKEWLDRAEETLVAAVTLGYADESPSARPRQPWPAVTEWRHG